MLLIPLPSSVLYANREGKDRFDAIDLDPYGTAAPFIDGAVQAVNDGGEHQLASALIATLTYSPHQDCSV